MVFHSEVMSSLTIKIVLRTCHVALAIASCIFDQHGCFADGVIDKGN